MDITVIRNNTWHLSFKESTDITVHTYWTLKKQGHCGQFDHRKTQLPPDRTVSRQNTSQTSRILKYQDHPIYILQSSWTHCNRAITDVTVVKAIMVFNDIMDITLINVITKISIVITSVLLST
jgi:hypothetical protein